MGTRCRVAVAVLVITAWAMPAVAEVITLNYVVHVTQRAGIVGLLDATAPDPRIGGLQTTAFTDFDLTFNLTATFEVNIAESPEPFGLRINFGTPTFSPIPIPYPNLAIFGGTHEASAYGSTAPLLFHDDPYVRRWGLGFIETRYGPIAGFPDQSVLLAQNWMTLQSILPEDGTPLTLENYLTQVRTDLPFDLVTWSFDNVLTEQFTSDSYVYRGTAHFVAQPVPEPTTVSLVTLGLVGLLAGGRRRRTG
jgi:hypothetical protein